MGGEHLVPTPDPVASEYLLLALRLDQHIPGLVDGYYGPRDLKARADTEELPSAARLAADAAALRERVAREVAEPDRARWLDRQLLALETQAAALAGATLPYLDHVRQCFDADPEALPRDMYGEVRAELERLLPGSGDLRDRLAAFDARFVVHPDRVSPLVEWLVPRIREASARAFPAPDGEGVRVALVRGQPWSGYNWYDGGLRSRVDLNMDLPVRPHDLIATLVHETYPGHHLEHAWKEQRLVRTLGRLEASVLLINAPECYVSEGLAELGRRYTLDDAAWLDLLVGAYETAGVAAGMDDARLQLEVGESLHRIRGAGGDAALMLHAEGRPRDEVRRFLEDEALMARDRALKRLEFVEHPLWRTYVFSYSGGERLLRRWCEAPGHGALAGATPASHAPADGGTGAALVREGRADAQETARFFRLLTEQLTPSGVADDLDVPGTARSGARAWLSETVDLAR